MVQVDNGINQRVTVLIEYQDGTSERLAMTKKEAIELQDAVASGRKPGIKKVSW